MPYGDRASRQIAGNRASLRRAVEHDAHAIQQINNSRRRFAHALYERLICQEIATINCVVKMFRGGVAFALLVFAALIPPCAQTECDASRAQSKTDPPERRPPPRES